MRHRCLVGLVVLMLAGHVPSSVAATAIDKTRLILDAATRQTSLVISNRGTTPVLIQSWVDSGQSDDTPEATRLPFVIDPPIVRLDPSRSQSIHLLMTTIPPDLPADRESVFYLNVLEIPSRSQSSSPERRELQLAIRSRLKLFFRPADLPAYDLAGAEALEIALESSDAGPRLRIHNPAPIHRTLADISLGEDAAPRAIALDEPMIGPGQTIRVAVPESALSPGPGGLSIHYGTLNELGGIERHAQRLQRAP